MFSPTVRSGAIWISWWTLEMPALIASKGDLKSDGVIEEVDFAVVVGVDAVDDVQQR